MDVWRGVNAQDLRRAHLSWDYPAPCTTCPRTVGTEPPGASEFVERFMAETVGRTGVREPLEPLTPGLIARSGEPPRAAHAPARPARFAAGTWRLRWAASTTSCARSRSSPRRAGPRVQRLAFPRRRLAGDGAQPRLLVGAASPRLADGAWAGMRRPHCLVRHQAPPRIAAETLRYPSSNGEAATDSVAARHRLPEGRIRRAGRTGAQRGRRGAVPAGSICAVATKGDERLLDLGRVAGWHFPRGDDGRYAGYNPPDGRWAVEHLEELRAAGADYLVIPATPSGGASTIPSWPRYLRLAGTPVLEERDTCLIVGARGPEREEEAERRSATAWSRSTRSSSATGATWSPTSASAIRSRTRRSPSTPSGSRAGSSGATGRCGR